MNKIITINQTAKISKKLKDQGKKIVLAGGCFDILHIGHIRFLEEAKKRGDILFVLLESDQTIQKLKGSNRPINPCQIRTRVLAALEPIDYIVILPPLCKNSDYDVIIGDVKPDIIATTAGDPQRSHKERQAQLIHAKVIDVTNVVLGESTTKIAQLIEKDI